MYKYVLCFFIMIASVSLFAKETALKRYDQYDYEVSERASENAYPLLISHVDKKSQQITLSDGSIWEYGMNLFAAMPSVGSKVYFDYAFLMPDYEIWMEFPDSFGRPRPVWLSKPPKRAQTSQKIIAMDDNKEGFELEDGSYWKAASTLSPLFPSQSNIKKWHLGDRIVISKRKELGDNHYALINLEVIEKSQLKSFAFAKLKRTPDTK